MTTTAHIAELRENAKRQAKRLSKRLDVPLTAAKAILAKSCYRCEGWNDLEKRLVAKHPDERVTQLSSLPRSSAARTYFAQNIRDLARSLSRHVLVSGNLIGLYDTLNHVFNVLRKPVSLSDIAVSVHVSAWRSAGIGSDPNAVLETFAVINGVPLKLVATRTYLPKYFQFGPEVTSEPSLAEPLSGTFQVMWSNPRDWYNAAYTYLMRPDNDYEDLALPTETLNSVMEHHLGWFNRSLDVWREASSYGDHGEDFLPHVLPGLGAYLLFGFPIAVSSNTSLPPATVVAMAGDDADNDRTIMLLDGQPACLEWISASPKPRKHEGPYVKYFGKLLDAVFSHSECCLDSYGCYGHEGSYFFIRPAARRDIKQFLKVEFEPEPDGEAFVLKTDHPSLAVTILEKVATRELMTYPSGSQSLNYVVDADVSDDEQVHDVSISLEGLGGDFWLSNHLVLSRVVGHQDGRKKLYATITPEFLSLTDLVPRRFLRDALLFGIVLHRKSGFQQRLWQPPRRCKELRSAPEAIVDVIENSLSRALDDSPYNLFQHIKYIRYKRDND